MLEVFDNCILNWGGKNGVERSLHLKWANNVFNNIDERITHLANNLHKYNHTDCLWSQDVKNAFNDIHKSFVLVPLDKQPGVLLWFVTGSMPPLLQKNKDLILIYLQILIARSKVYLQLVLSRILESLSL